MYLNFQSIKNQSLGSFNVGHEYLDDHKASESFLHSLSCGEPFLVETCKLIIKSAARVEKSNGYMQFIAQAEFYNGTSDEVNGVISFEV